MQADGAASSGRDVFGLRELSREWRNFLRNWRVTRLVIAAVLKRASGVRRGRGAQWGFLLLMLEPLVMIGAISMLFYIINRPPVYGSNMTLFLATGVFPVYLFLHTSQGIQEPLNTAHLGSYTRELPLDSIIAHTILRGLASTTVALLFFWGLYLNGERQALPRNLDAAVLSLLYLFVLGVGFGVINPVIGRLFPVWDSIWPALSRASVHFAGMYYVPFYLPPNVRFYIGINPLAHGIDWFRTGFYPMFPAMILNFNYLYICLAVVLVTGLCLEKIFREKLQKGEK